MKDRVKAAEDLYATDTCTCGQAVLCAFADDVGLSEETAYRLAEAFGGGLGEQQELCCALAAACAVIGYHSSDGSIGHGHSIHRTLERTSEAMDRFRKENDGVTCRDVLHGGHPELGGCKGIVRSAAQLAQDMSQEDGDKQG